MAPRAFCGVQAGQVFCPAILNDLLYEVSSMLEQTSYKGFNNSAPSNVIDDVFVLVRISLPSKAPFFMPSI